MWIYIKPLLLEVVLVSVCLLGDHLLQNPLAKQRIVVAVTDSLCHGLVGGVSWAIVSDIQMKVPAMAECFLCMLLAMSVDVDHFIAARSFNLTAALSLPARPFFHSTTLIFIIDLVLVIVSWAIKSKNIQLLAIIFTTAWLSHHVRDAVRRGLWVYPFGETEPLPRLLYIGIIITLPLFMRLLYVYCKSRRLPQSFNIVDIEAVEH